MIEAKLGGTSDRPLAIHVLRGIKGHLWLDLVDVLKQKADMVGAILWKRRN